MTMVLPFFFKASFYGNLKCILIDKKWLIYFVPPVENIFFAFEGPTSASSI